MTKATLKSTSQEKSFYTNKMFSEIATKYDLLNNLMTFGMHHHWKKETIQLTLKENNNPKTALDLCSGTGDLAIILNNRCPSIRIVCADNCNNMLKIAKKKIDKLPTENITISFLNSESLPFEQNSFDLITIGFGLRNLVDKEICLQNIYKILTIGGVFACIDLGHPTNKLWGTLYNYYFFKIIPLLGYLFANNKEAYTYLPNSLITWYKQEKLKETLLTIGFKKCFFKNIFGGVIAIHIAVK